MIDTDPAHWLSDVEEAGACFIDEADIDELIAAGEQHGLLVHRIDLTDCDNKAQVLQRLSQALQFPDWFGDNWDALADSLNDLSWLPAPGYLTVIDHFDAWQQAQPDEVDTLLDIFDSAALQWADAGIPFWLMLPLPDARLAALPASATIEIDADRDSADR